jgi:hypothetical protein
MNSGIVSAVEGKDLLPHRQTVFQGRCVLGTASLAAVFLVATVLINMAVEPSRHVLFVLVSPAVFGGLAALVVTCLVAYFSRKPLTCCDVIRMGCWTFVGASLMVSHSDKYYYVYWPTYLSTMRMFSRVLWWAGLCGLVAASMILRLWKGRHRNCLNEGG